MSLIRKFIDKIRRRTSAPPPVITTEWGPVPEHMRAQAATNMRLDANLRDRVLAMLVKEMKSEEAGRAEFRRRYPEVEL